jgi:hypothetical protein
MTAAAPEPVEFVPAWLSPADVREWLRLNGTPSTDDGLVTRCAAAVEAQVQSARPDRWVIHDPDEPNPPDPPPLTWPSEYVPDAEVYQAGVQLAARLVRRRNSPGGLESFAESLVYVSAYDPEIQRALRQGPWRRLLVG